jgi:hypothetical protein
MPPLLKLRSLLSKKVELGEKNQPFELERTLHMSNEKKTVTIVVNGTPHEWPKEEITYAQVATLDVPDYEQHPEVTYSVKYKRGHGDKPEGILSIGGSVKVKEGMVFSVSKTGQS